YADDGIVQQAARALRAEHPDLIVMTDVCLCEYTTHGHCGLVRDGEVDNDATLEVLGRTAVTQAVAGADVVAPSAMMDGQVAAIRRALDEAGCQHVAIMGYSAKYASAFYGPFRDAAGSAPQFGDRRGYQMNPPNAREAEREVAQDLSEGADIVMVKPALPYLDVLHRIRHAVTAPLAAYNVSGEYARVKAAVQQGGLDERRTVLERLTAIARAGVGRFMRVAHSFVGLLRPSRYVKRPGTQEQGLLDGERAAYLIVYPFTKTHDWYRLGPDVRQGMMNEHIRIGHDFPQVRQLLAYSTGLDDQEFIVAYETDDLAVFQDLVTALRDTEGRRYTLRDQPILTAIHRPLDDALRQLG